MDRIGRQRPDDPLPSRHPNTVDGTQTGRPGAYAIAKFRTLRPRSRFILPVVPLRSEGTMGGMKNLPTDGSSEAIGAARESLRISGEMAAQMDTAVEQTLATLAASKDVVI